MSADGRINPNSMSIQPDFNAQSVSRRGTRVFLSAL